MADASGCDCNTIYTGKFCEVSEECKLRASTLVSFLSHGKIASECRVSKNCLETNEFLLMIPFSLTFQLTIILLLNEKSYFSSQTSSSRTPISVFLPSFSSSFSVVASSVEWISVLVDLLLPHPHATRPTRVAVIPPIVDDNLKEDSDTSSRPCCSHSSP